MKESDYKIIRRMAEGYIKFFLISAAATVIRVAAGFAVPQVIRFAVDHVIDDLPLNYSKHIISVVDAMGVWWAADEWFDAGDAAVANAARRHYLERAPKPLALADSHQILYSPLRFGTYTASALAATCPGR